MKDREKDWEKDREKGREKDREKENLPHELRARHRVHLLIPSGNETEQVEIRQGGLPLKSEYTNLFWEGFEIWNIEKSLHQNCYAKYPIRKVLKT